MNYIEYRILSLKNLRIIMVTIMAGIGSVFSLFIIFAFMNVWITLMFIIPALMLPITVIFIKASKVRLGTDYVEAITLFRSKRIDFKDINNFGVFFSSAYTWPQVTSQRKIEDYDLENQFGYQIYLTTNTEFDLHKFKPARHIRFHYKRELYFKIKERLGLLEL